MNEETYEMIVNRILITKGKLYEIQECIEFLDKFDKGSVSVVRLKEAQDVIVDEMLGELKRLED